MKLLLHEMEHIRDIYHESAVVLIKPFAVMVIGVALPWYFSFQYGLEGKLRLLLFLIITAAVIHTFRQIVIWRLNSYIVTNKRLVKLSHDGLFKRTVIETPHERILNVSYKTTGLLSVLFRFGDVEVQVVGLVEPIVLRNITMPAAIKDYLWELHNRVATTQGVFQASDVAHLQERVGYTKKDQRIL